MRSNPIAARLRQVVSQDRMRYKDADTGADMDLSYITSTIIGTVVSMAARCELTFLFFFSHGLPG
jgi:hypothetical protein